MSETFLVVPPGVEVRDVVSHTAVHRTVSHDKGLFGSNCQWYLGGGRVPATWSAWLTWEGGEMPHFARYL